MEGGKETGWVPVAGETGVLDGAGGDQQEGPSESLEALARWSGLDTCLSDRGGGVVGRQVLA